MVHNACLTAPPRFPQVCDREMASASAALSKLQTWVPHRANPLLLKAPVPLQASSSSSCTVATTLTAPTYTDHGSLTTATAGSLVGPSWTSTSTSTGVRSRLLQRVRGLPLNARFSFGLDMLHQLEEVWRHPHHISISFRFRLCLKKFESR